MKTYIDRDVKISNLFQPAGRHSSHDPAMSSPPPAVARRPHRTTRGATWIATAVFSTLGLATPIPAGAQGGAMSTEQVSISTIGEGGNGSSRGAAISSDGRFVVFESGATNLVLGTEASSGLYLRDRFMGTTERIPLPAGETIMWGGPSISGDGRFVVFPGTGPQVGNAIVTTYVYLHDRIASTTERISVTPPDFLASMSPQISRDGRAIVYLSLTATPLNADGVFDVLVYDRETRQTVTANTTSAGQVISAPYDMDLAVAISGDGRVVAFPFSAALVPGTAGGQVFVHDLVTRETTIASTTNSGTPSGGHFRPALSDNGRFVAFYSSYALVPDDTNGMPDTYIRDRALQMTERVSVDDNGNQVPNGTNLADSPAISADGRFVAFVSLDAALAHADTNGAFDVFVRDRQMGTTARVSVASDGTEANDISFGPALTADGQAVAFTSWASNLAATKNPTAPSDVYVHQMLTAPVLSAIVPSRTELWPPNGKLREIQLAYSTTGGVGQILCHVTVTGDEPVRTRGRAATVNSEVVDAHTIRLRATPLLAVSDRVYAITVHCVDEAGQSVSGTTRVTVPQDRGASK
jgi:Tol biopolymer transport system component